MNNKMDNTLVFIDLDAILDTRIGTLMRYNPEWGNELVMHPGYYDRDDDLFNKIIPDIDIEQYKIWYANRDKETLKFSRPTNIVFTLLDLINVMSIEIHTVDNAVQSGGIIVNTYPYQLTKEEDYYILQALMSYFGEEIRIRLTHLETAKVSLAYLDQINVGTYVTYDFREWTRIHLGHIEDIKDYPSFPHISVIAPSLSDDFDKLKQMYAEYPQLKDEDNPYEITRWVLAPHLGITYVHPKVMSYVDLDAQKSGD